MYTKIIISEEQTIEIEGTRYKERNFPNSASYKHNSYDVSIKAG